MRNGLLNSLNRWQTWETLATLNSTAINKVKRLSKYLRWMRRVLPTRLLFRASVQSRELFSEGSIRMYVLLVILEIDRYRP